MKESDANSYMFLTKCFALSLGYYNSIEKYMNSATLITMHESTIYINIKLTVSDNLFIKSDMYQDKTMQFSLLKHLHVVKTYKRPKTIIPPP